MFDSDHNKALSESTRVNPWQIDPYRWLFGHQVNQQSAEVVCFDEDPLVAQSCHLR